MKSSLIRVAGVLAILIVGYLLLGIILPITVWNAIGAQFLSEIWAIIGSLLWFVPWYFVWKKYLLRVDVTPPKKGEWEFVINLFVAIFAIGGLLLGVPALFEQAITRSQCISPPEANVSSPNCKVIETVALPNPGPYGWMKTIGTWVVLLGLFSIMILSMTVVVVYVLFWKRSRK